MMAKMRALLVRLRSDRGDLATVVGVTLLVIVIGTIITIQTVSAAAVMRAALVESEIRDAVTNVSDIALNRLSAEQDIVPDLPVTDQGDALLSYSTLNATAYVQSVVMNADNSTITVNIVGESHVDAGSRITFQENFYMFEANYYAGVDQAGAELWVSTGGATPFTGYRGGAR